mgnify:CR=1 FL=1
MKKIWICLLCLLLTVSAAACGGTGGESYASAEPSISEAESLPEASGSPDVSEISGSESFAASEAVSDSHNSETVEARTPSERYDALMERVNAGNIYIEMAGNLFGVETEFAVAERDGVVTTRQTIEGETTYTMVRDGKSYVFDLLSPYYYVTEEETAADEMRFLSEGSEELNGKVYDFVLCEMPEDETQKLTFLLEGEALYAIRITIQMGDSTMQALLTVTAFTEEIPDDIPFELPKGYTPMSLMRRSNSPPRCLRLMPAPFTPLHPQPARMPLSTSSPNRPTAAHILKRSKQPASVKLIGRNRACLQRRKTASS